MCGQERLGPEKRGSGQWPAPPRLPPPPPPPSRHMKGAAQGQWMTGGVCAMRGPQTQTQHNTRLCGPPQLGWNVTCFRLGPECVKHKWGRRRTRTEGCRERRGESWEERVGFPCLRAAAGKLLLVFIFRCFFFLNQQSLFVSSEDCSADNKNVSSSLCN